MSHLCEKEKDFEEIKKEIYGNGKPGLKEKVIRMDIGLKGLNDSTNNLATAVSGLTKFMNETQGSRQTVRWLVGIIITVVIAFSGITITLLTKIVGS